MIWNKKRDEVKPEAVKSTDSGSSNPALGGASTVTPIVSKPTESVPMTGAIPLSTSMIERPASRMPENVRSVLSEGTVINGRLTFDTPVKIDGKLTGEVFSSDVLVVGKTGKIDAKIDVQTLVVQGHVSGEVKARDTIEVVEGGVLTADITTKKLIIRDAVFSGGCKMS